MMPKREVNVLFLDDTCVTRKILARVRNWRKPNLRLWFRSKDVSSIAKYIRDLNQIDSSIKIDHSIGLFEWSIDGATVRPVTDVGLRAMVSRMDSQGLEFVIVGQGPRCKNRFVGFHDALNRQDLPDKFYKVRWFGDGDELERYCDEIGLFEFHLDDPNRFEKTSHVENGASVYRELSTRRLIYKDMLHKTHYEVFDKFGRHLGEMSIQGVLDCSRVDVSKRIDVS